MKRVGKAPAGRQNSAFRAIIISYFNIVIFPYSICAHNIEFTKVFPEHVNLAMNQLKEKKNFFFFLFFFFTVSFHSSLNNFSPFGKRHFNMSRFSSSSINSHLFTILKQSSAQSGKNYFKRIKTFSFPITAKREKNMSYESCCVVLS